MAAAPGIDSLLRAAATDAPERAALAFGERTLTWREVDEAVDSLAARLHARAGARVGVIAANSPALVIALFACWRREAVAVPLSARLRRFELGRIVADAEIETLVTVTEHARFSFEALVPELMACTPALGRCLMVETRGNVVRELISPAQETEPLGADLAAVLYTSGTTGAPKGAFDTHERELAGAASTAGVLGLTGSDSVVLAVPVSHAFGLICLLGTVAAAATAVLLEGGLPAAPLVRAIAGRGASVMHGSPSLFAALLKTGAAQLAPVRTGFVAGAACPPPLLERLDAMGPRILNLFGMTEIGAATACRGDDPPEVRHHTVGRPLDGYEVRVREGEVEVRSPHVTAPFAGEWFRTGDLGALDAGGNLTLSGRAKE